jgi:hypothetical protein
MILEQGNCNPSLGPTNHPSLHSRHQSPMTALSGESAFMAVERHDMTSMEEIRDYDTYGDGDGVNESRRRALLEERDMLLQTLHGLHSPEHSSREDSPVRENGLSSPPQKSPVLSLMPLGEENDEPLEGLVVLDQLDALDQQLKEEERNLLIQLRKKKKEKRELIERQKNEALAAEIAQREAELAARRRAEQKQDEIARKEREEADKVARKERERREKEEKERRIREEREEKRLQLLRDEQANLADPAQLSIQVFFYLSPQSLQKRHDCIYRFHLPLSSCVGDLQAMIAEELHMRNVQDVTLFYRHMRLSDPTQCFDTLPGWYADAAVLFIPSEFSQEEGKGKRQAHSLTIPPDFLRPPVTITLNDSGNNDDDKDKDNNNKTAERNWMREWEQLGQLVRENAKDRSIIMAAKEQQLLREFTQCAKACVEAIVLNPEEHPPVSLGGLYGPGGDKYLAGGMVIRKAAHWDMLRDSTGEGDVAFKCALLELRALQEVRRLAGVQGVIAPLACCIDCYGHRFLCQARLPISMETMIYGSLNDGCTLIQDYSPEQEAMLRSLAEQLNTRSPLRVQLSSTPHQSLSVPLPLTCQVFMVEGIYYLLCAECFAPADNPRLSHDNAAAETNTEENEAAAEEKDVDTGADAEGEIIPDISDLMARRLRFEISSHFGVGQQTEPGYQYYTSLQPRACDECGQVIVDFEYYRWNGGSPNGSGSGSRKNEYEVCPACYDGNKSSELLHRKFRLEKMIVPEMERVSFWKHDVTGHVCVDRPIAKTPFHPGIFFPWIEASDGPADYQVTVAAATYVREVVLRQFLEALDSMEITPATGFELVTLMHAQGLNARHLGHIATLAHYNHIRELAVREMLARTVKRLVLDGLSFLERPTLESSRVIIAHYFNQVFTSQATEDSAIVWKYIRDISEKKFNFAPSPDVRAKLHLLPLLHQMCAALGVTLRQGKNATSHPGNDHRNNSEKSADDNDGDSDETAHDGDDLRGFDFSGKADVFSEDDFVGLEPRVHDFTASIPFIERLLVEARHLHVAGAGRVWHVDNASGHRIQASEMFLRIGEAAVRVYGSLHLRTAEIFLEIAQHFEERHIERGNRHASRWNKCAGIPEDSLSTESRRHYQIALDIFGKTIGPCSYPVAECLIGLARLDKSSMASSSGEKTRSGANPAQLRALRRACALCEICVGFHFPQTGDMYYQLALALEEAGLLSEAALYIRKAFTVVLSIYGENHPITLQMHGQLKVIEVAVGSGLESVAIDALTEAIETLEFDVEAFNDALRNPSHPQLQWKLSP